LNRNEGAPVYCRLIFPHQLSLSQDAPIHHTNRILFRRARFEGDFGVERVEFEKITVRTTGGRTGTAIADALEIVDALLRPVGKGFGAWNLLWKLRLGWRQAVKDPVDPPGNSELFTTGFFFPESRDSTRKRKTVAQIRAHWRIKRLPELVFRSATRRTVRVTLLNRLV